MDNPFSRRDIRRGKAVYWIQQNLYWLNFNSVDNRDGKFGPKTEYWVKRFQKHKGLKVDGIVGTATVKVLWDEVKKYQRILNSLGHHVVPDGLAGPLTFKATRDFQYKHLLLVDGICGPATRRKLIRETAPPITKPVEPTKPVKLVKPLRLIEPAEPIEPVKEAVPKRGAVDIGHLGKDSGAFHGSEKEVTLNTLIGKCLADKLLEAGLSVRILSGTLRERCDVANSWGADFIISVHCNASTDEKAHGVEVWYASETGRKLASLILKGYPPEFYKRGVKKGNFYVLRHTKAPCVIVECGFISNPTERKLLFTLVPEISGAIADAVIRWCDQNKVV